MVALVGDVQAVADKLASAKKHVSHSNVGFPEGFSTWTAARRSPLGGGGPR
jgi:hypothetical protein